MDQPAIYSETVREGIGGACGRVGVLAFDAATRRYERFGDCEGTGWLKTGAGESCRESYPGRAEFFALPIFRRASRWNVPGSRLQATDRSANL